MNTKTRQDFWWENYFLLRAHLPVNTVRIEDHNESVHAKDDSDDDCGHLGDLQKGVEEKRMKFVPSVPKIPPWKSGVKDLAQGKDKL